jgi:hypothetical protein
MPVTINADLVDDSDILANERVIDMDNEISMLEPEFTQFTTILNRVSSKPATSSKVEWLEDQLFPRLSALSASITAASATMPVTTGEGPYFRLGDVVRIPVSGEAVAVSAAPATDVVGITRSIGSVAAATAASLAELVIIGNAAAQGASLGVRKVTERVAAYNYTQIFRHPYGFTRTLTQSKLYGGSEPMKERKKKAIEHKRALESANFFGPRDLDTGGTEPKGYMGGLIEYISTLIKDPSGAMDKAEFETFMTAWLHRAKTPLLFVSPTVASIISGYARDNWVRSKQPDTTWGNVIDAYVSGAFGFEVPVVVKREWHEFATTSSQYGSIAFGVDMAHVQARPMQTTQLLLNRQGNSEDQVVEEYLTETTLQVEQEKHHLYIENATS